MNDFEKRLLETWYFTETVEGISSAEEFLSCDYEIHEQYDFDTWLKEQELEEEYKEWVKKVINYR